MARNNTFNLLFAAFQLLLNNKHRYAILLGRLFSCSSLIAFIETNQQLQAISQTLLLLHIFCF